MVVFCLGFVIIPSAAYGQEQGPANANAPVTQADLAKLREDMKADTKAAIEAALAGLASPQNADLEPIRSIPEVSNRFEQRLQAVEDELSEMRSVQRDLGVALGDIAMKNESGGYDLRLDRIRQAIKGTVPRRGDFIIRNRTRWNQEIIVNGYQYHIPPYETLPLRVQPGTVVSRLPGQQSYTWNIGLPDFQQVIDLQEREPTYVARWVGY
jgi:hypothetical protein